MAASGAGRSATGAPAIGDDPGAVAESQLFNALYWRAIGANLIGAALAFVYLTFISPPQPQPPHGEALLFTVIAPLYVLATAALGRAIGKREWRPVGQWLGGGRAAGEQERELVLGLPWRMASAGLAGWLGAVLIFGVTTATHHPAVFVAGVAVGILLAGLTSSAVTFLLVERRLRPVFARALANAPHSHSHSLAGKALRTRTRLFVSWALGSGIALVAIPLAFLGRGDSSGEELIGPVVFLVLAGLFGGGVLIMAAARSVSEPVERLRRSVHEVEHGSFDERVSVDDGGEIGLLQAGFNRMVAGLREREEIREAFGTYVDREVAEHILREGTSLAGEEVEVTILVLDIRGFTALAERLSAQEVVATLNRLFERVVPLIRDCGGHVDKYVGDGLLAVFGAPRRHPDHADRALSAALAIAAAVEADFAGELSIGIGLNSGSVVAGNVGGAGRLEFSVIGDTVNVAARVESATRETGDTVLISASTRRLLDEAEVALEERRGMTLKGKREPVDLFAPRVAARAPN